VKDALSKGIQLFNKQNEGIRLVGITEKFKIKLSKKSGLPDLDLPCKIKNNALLNF
jgi:hypothetical protein